MRGFLDDLILLDLEGMEVMKDWFNEAESTGGKHLATGQNDVRPHASVYWFSQYWTVKPTVAVFIVTQRNPVIHSCVADDRGASSEEAGDN